MIQLVVPPFSTNAMTSVVHNRKIDTAKYRMYRRFVSQRFDAMWNSLREFEHFTPESRFVASVSVVRYLLKDGGYPQGCDLDNSLKALWDCLFDDLNRTMYPAEWAASQTTKTRKKSKLPLDDAQIDRYNLLERVWTPFVPKKDRPEGFANGAVRVSLRISHPILPNSQPVPGGAVGTVPWRLGWYVVGDDFPELVFVPTSATRQAGVMPPDRDDRAAD